MGIITLLDPDSIGFSTEEKVYREGIELEKGVVLTPDFVEAHQDLIEKYTQFFLAYPDVFLDIIKPSYINFNLYPFQRVILRACMRYNTIFITACRAASKTFLSILAKYLQCVFVPGHNGSIVAPNKNQAAKISQQKIKEIWKLFPLLEKEVEKANMGKDYTDIKFKNDSTLSIAAALDSDRGLRKHSCLVDETRDQDGEALAEIILPQLNVSRRMENGEVNPYEMINQQVIYTTSAGLKSSFAKTIKFVGEVKPCELITIRCGIYSANSENRKVTLCRAS